VNANDERLQRAADSALGDRLCAVDDYRVIDEDALTYAVARTSRGWTAEVQVTTRVEIDGDVFGGERIIRIPLMEVIRA